MMGDLDPEEVTSPEERRAARRRLRQLMGYEPPDTWAWTIQEYGIAADVDLEQARREWWGHALAAARQHGVRQFWVFGEGAHEEFTEAVRRHAEMQVRAAVAFEEILLVQALAWHYWFLFWLARQPGWAAYAEAVKRRNA